MKKLYVENNKKIILSFILLFFSILILSISLCVNKKDKSSLTIKINYLPYLIQEENININSSKYYLLSDENNNLYITHLSDKIIKKIENKYYNNMQFSYSITASKKRMPNDVKNLLTSIYENKSSELSNLIMKENYNIIYLDTSYMEIKYFSDIFLSISIILMSLAFIKIIDWLFYIVLSKQILSNYDLELLEKELINAKEYKKLRIYLTDNFFISTYRGLHIHKYNEIIWMYSNLASKTETGNKVYLKIYFSDKSRYNTKPLRYSNKQLYDEVLNEIKYNHENILVNYNEENLNEYQNVKNNLKITYSSDTKKFLFISIIGRLINIIIIIACLKIIIKILNLI